MDNADRWLMVATQAARAAAIYLAEHWEKPQEALARPEHDVKLAADRESERLILEKLRDTPFPVVSEETRAESPPRDGSPWWAVDPLDGTVNYERGFPFCAISVALLEGDTPILGVVHDFVRREEFTAMTGRGAWLNGRAIHPAPVPADPGQALLGWGHPLTGTLSETELARHYRVQRHFRKVRQMGSAALAMAYVACGRLDAYWIDGIMVWDVAAGTAIINAAGGWSLWEPVDARGLLGISRSASSQALWDKIPVDPGT